MDQLRPCQRGIPDSGYILKTKEEKRRVKAIKLSLKVIRDILSVVLAVVLLLNLIGVFKKLVLKEDIPLVFGFGYAIILSGSMEPEFYPGDMVVIHKEAMYEAGDIVTFQQSGRPVTHRISEETTDGFITKGDFNNSADQEIVKRNQVIGKIIKVIPQAGDAVDFFQSTTGMILILLALFAATVIPGMVRRKKYEPEKGTEMTQ
jgi:signal peptidase